MRAFIFMCVLAAAKATRGISVAGAHVSGATGELSRAGEQQDSILLLATDDSAPPATAAAAAAAIPAIRRQAPTLEQSLASRRQGKGQRLLRQGKDSSSCCGWQTSGVGGTGVRGGGAFNNSSRRTGRHEQEDEEGRREQRMVRSVLLYYPNLIGYARVALVLTSYYLAETKWKASSGCYLVAFAGDAVDGHVARKFNQASRFGAVLDMVTDRCSTAGLLLVLSRLYDHRHAFAFLLLMFVDLFSHWMHTHSVLDKHHKSTTTLRRRNVFIRTYYDNLPFFAFCCIGTELFYVLLYLLHFLPKDGRVYDPLRKICYWVCLPACVLKQAVNIAQISSAARTLALEELDQHH